MKIDPTTQSDETTQEIKQDGATIPPPLEIHSPLFLRWMQQDWVPIQHYWPKKGKRKKQPEVGIDEEEGTSYLMNLVAAM